MSRSLVRPVVAFLLAASLVVPNGVLGQSAQAAPKTPSKSTTPSKKSTKKPSSAKRTAAKRRKRMSPRVRRVRQAFVASASLRPMAQQLVQDRTPAAYAGVEAYARKHAKEDAGALAWLVVGYAHALDHDYAKAVDPLNRAKAGAGELGDYVAYYLGDAYYETGHSPEALATLSDFDKKFPDSLLVRDVRLVYANTLIRENRTTEAAAVLEKDRLPVRSDIELAVGRAYAALGQNEKAAPAFRNLYFNMPTSSEADVAGGELKKLKIVGNLAERRTRADLLFKARRYSDAADEYRGLVNEVSPEERPKVQIALATSLQRGDRSREAQQLLTAIGPQTGDAEAQRLFLLGEAERSSNDEPAVQKTLAQLRQFGPTSPWLEQALLSAGNMYLLKPDYDRAIDHYRELQQRFPKGARASYAHWKTAWLSFRQGRMDEARQGFEDQIALYSDSNEVPAALYWRARMAEEEGAAIMARAFYQKLSSRYRNYYYAELGRQRLKNLKGEDDESTHYALLDRIPPLSLKDRVAESEPPEEDLRLQRARLLSNGALSDLAARELQAAAADGGGSWAWPELARIYQDCGQFDRGIQVLKRAMPNYFAVDLPELPRSYWDALFPKPYWSDLRRYSVQNGLEPYLVASLIRQESEFNPLAVSRANAVGLMQLLPKVGKHVAKEIKLKGYNPSQLYTPTVNLQLGTHYFKSMVDKYGGQLEYALAAYNAGTDRVDDWRGIGHYRDTQEFVESIPFTETREYVQAILRNTTVYQRLYGTP
ncbi:MAG TPA: transglycosylase SLT domain-containing protein [Terriglobales bacterium]|nr:transglycosylase SLT domain-containing protein [Terriglobales bacterium]